MINNYIYIVLPGKVDLSKKCLNKAFSNATNLKDIGYIYERE